MKSSAFAHNGKAIEVANNYTLQCVTALYTTYLDLKHNVTQAARTLELIVDVLHKKQRAQGE